ncbi:MAG: ABC transporter ATP-binding protein [Thermoleophilia bacterium]|nr:ABC transporter ATP-binding protein [Thermoleophilia bacterium]
MTKTSRKPSARDVLRLGRALRLVWRIAPGWTVASVLLTVLQGVLPLATVWLMKLIVDTVTAGIGGPDRTGVFREVAILIILAGAVGLAVVILRSLASIVDEALGRTVTDHVTDVIHAQSVTVDLEYYENPRYHDALYRAQQEAPHRPTSIVKNLTSTGQALVTLVSMAALLLTLHWAVGLIVLGAAVPGAVVRFLYSRKLFAWQRRRTETERQSYYAHWLLTDSEHAKEIRLFGLGERFRGWYRELRHKLRGELIGLATKRSLADLAAGAVAVLAVFGTFAFIAWRAVQGTITVGMMVAYYQAFQTSLGSLQAVLRGFAALYEDSLFLTYYDEFMSLEPRVRPPADPKPVPRAMVDGIRFDHVDFGYPDTERTALRDISLVIRPGEVTAFVGPNGSGKTTLVKRLCRLYDPTAGSITLDGIDLRRFDVVELRRHMSIIFQDFAQYQLTVRENIRLGDVMLDGADTAIEEAARDAGAHDVITGLRHGYGTILGKWFDEGEELSVGEWQKIALARAFVRNAQILVLDEPTSALDPQAEWNVFAHIKALARGRAVVLISHRFSTVRTADRIHIFDQGRVIESGTHDELVALGGRYAEMYEVQARAYSQTRD